MNCLSEKQKQFHFPEEAFEELEDVGALPEDVVLKNYIDHTNPVNPGNPGVGQGKALTKQQIVYPFSIPFKVIKIRVYLIFIEMI
jgi:hypothetical protein